MEQRELGKSGIKVGKLAFGTNVLRWTIDDAMAFKLLDAFTGSGLNLIDTADVYSKWVPGNTGGESETVIGKWMKQNNKRKDVIIATKVGHTMGMGNGMKGLSKKYIMQAVEASLRRLQTDYIDLYQSHEDDLNTPIEETLETYALLVKQGKVRAIGASNFKADRLEKSLEISKKSGYPSYQTLQPQYNLYDRAEFEKDLEPLCLKKNVGVICFYGLAKGFLTGKYRTKEDASNGAHGSRVVTNYMNDRGMRILKALDEVSKQHSSNPARVALAWLMARPSITAPIASATNLKQMEDLVQSVHLNLNKGDIESLNTASAY
ncbi:MAG TPA: aldo/keto reductase [Bacteroidia bacterium]|nr:aldo/keto reductase [Bacteroidia bacterium]